MEIKTDRLTLFTINKKMFKSLRKVGVFNDPINLEIVKLHLKKYRKNETLMKWSLWVIKLNHNQKIIGEIGFHALPDLRGEVDLGYVIYQDYRGHGYASEGVKSLTNYVKDQEGVSHVIADCLKSNAASIRVLEKTGFKFYYEADQYFFYKK